MIDNLIFYSVPDQNNEIPEKTIRTFLKEEMEINEADLTKIACDRIQEPREKISPLIRTFNLRTVKDILYKHRQCFFLNNQKRFGTNNQLPFKLGERKKKSNATEKQRRQQSKSHYKMIFYKLIINIKGTDVKNDIH